MPSLRKRVSTYFRQLSFHNEIRDKRSNFIENTFINKYLEGQIKLREGPQIIYGKNPTDLPNYDLGSYMTGSNTIVGCCTGPHAGLISVRRPEKHLTIPDEELDFIDTQEQETKATVEATKQVLSKNSSPSVDNTVMVIRVAGQEYLVTNRKERRRASKSNSLDLNRVEIDKTRKIKSHEAESRPAQKDAETKSDSSIVLAKSKSEGDPFRHKNRRPSKGKVTKIAHRATSDVDGKSTESSSIPAEWNRRSDCVFGISDSLYDKNLVTKHRHGNPIADCYGVIARADSAILAVADGVNWGEKASIAAKSAVHGSLHYLNQTLFSDTSPFDVLGNQQTMNQTLTHDSPRMVNTREVFVCLLRAFNCAHDLILENAGMLTTLTVAVVLPLRLTIAADGPSTEEYVCCVCNVGDTLAYVYSQKYGVRELTKGSHDVCSNRDMRDALGALGPVVDMKPELSNLTLSITRVSAGDIVLIASDGLTDNFDPNVCKFTAMHEQQANKSKAGASTSAKPPTGRVPPTKPPRTSLKREESLRKKAGGQPKRNDIMKSTTTSMIPSKLPDHNRPGGSSTTMYSFLRSKTSVDLRGGNKSSSSSIIRNSDGLPLVSPMQRYELSLLLMEDILERGISGREKQVIAARALCESLHSFTVNITNAKRRALEDKDCYYDDRNGVLMEVSAQEKKNRRRRALEKVVQLPGKLDHVTIVAYNVGNRIVKYQQTTEL